MEVYLLDRPKYHRLYNCSLYDVDQLPYDQRAHPYWGSAFLVGYVIFMALYVPCLWAMLTTPTLRKKASYKLMIQLGFTQIIGLQFAGLYNGVQAIFGIMFCSAPDFEYVSGLFVNIHWVITSATCDVLGINRLCALYSSALTRKIFGGYKLYFWMILPPVYGAVMLWYMPPLVYNSKMMAFFSNPYYGYVEDTTNTYFNRLIAIHNTSVCVIEIFILLAMPLLYFRAVKFATNEFKLRMRYERQIYVQVLFIGLSNFIASGIYDVMQVIPISFATTLTGTISYLLSQGLVSIVYLTINRSIRRTISNKLGLSRDRILPFSRQIVKSSSTQRIQSQEVPRIATSIRVSG